MRAAVIDLDGTVYRSTEGLPGAKEGIATLRDAGMSIAFVSNTSTKSRETCLSRLERLGVEADREDVITSAAVTADYVARTYPGATAFAVGQAALFDELRAAGVEVTDDPRESELVVVGKDRSFDDERRAHTLQALGTKVPFVVTNTDRVSPTSEGIEPGTGVLVDSLVSASNREPDVVAGKPYEPMIDATLNRLGLPASDCLVVGDNPEVDVSMGARAGMTTVLVLSGVADSADVETRSVTPDYVIESIGEIGCVLDVVRD